MEAHDERKRFIPIPSVDTSFHAISLKEPQSLKSNKHINIKHLLRSVQNTNKHVLQTRKETGNSISEEITTSVTTESFTSRLQEILKVRIPKLQTTRANSNSTCSPKLKKITLPSPTRDRRLQDIENYRKIRTKGLTGGSNEASASNLKRLPPAISPFKKCSSMTQTSLVSLVKKREENGTVDARSSIFNFAENASTVFSIDSPQRENDALPYTLKNLDPILSRDNFSPDSASKSPSSLTNKDKWKEYNEKASENLITLKPLTKSQKELSADITPKTSDQRYSSVERLQVMKPIYSNFVQEKFKPNTLERLDTLAAFAFSSVEKDENKEIPNFLSATRSQREPEGSMRVIDLWSTKHKHKVLKYADLEQEKRKIQRFTIVRKKDKTPERKGSMVKKDDDKVRGSLAIKELNKAIQKNQEEGLMSPMKRHLNLQGKSFYKAKKSAIFDFQEGVANKQLADNLGILFNDIEKLQEANQNEYVQILGLCTANEKIKMAKELKESIRIHKVNKHLDVESWKAKL